MDCGHHSARWPNRKPEQEMFIRERKREGHRKKRERDIARVRESDPFDWTENVILDGDGQHAISLGIYSCSFIGSKGRETA